MEYGKPFFEKVFSSKRMERYFALYPDDEEKAVLHYQCNLKLSEALYTSLSVFEVTLRNALCRELETMTNRRFRNRIFHNESICWNLNRVEEIHAEMLKVIGWMNRDLPIWVQKQERFDEVCNEIRFLMGWE